MSFLVRVYLNVLRANVFHALCDVIPPSPFLDPIYLEVFSVCFLVFDWFFGVFIVLFDGVLLLFCCGSA